MGKAARLLANLKKVLLWIKAFILQLSGSFSYRPPAWWERLVSPDNVFVNKLRARKAQFALWRSQHKKIVWTTYSLVTVGAITWGSWFYYTNYIPHPEWTTFEVQVPASMDYLVRTPVPNPVRIRFSRSVADLALVGKPITEGVELSPSIKGKWIFENDRTLAFFPETEWKLAEKFSFTMTKKIFSKSTTLATYSGDFKAHGFSISLNSSEFNQHPTIPKEKKGVVSLRFSHPVNPASLSDHISLKLVDEKGHSKDIKFSLQYGDAQLTAYIHSEFLAIPERNSQLNVMVSKGIQSTAEGKASDDEVQASIDVPGMYNYFKITGVNPQVVHNEKFEPEHVLIVTTSTSARSEDVAKSIKAYLLPIKNPNYDQNKAQDYNEDNEDEGEGQSPRVTTNGIDPWSSVGEVDHRVQKIMTPIELEVIPSELENSTVHSFKFKAPVERWMHIQIAKGLKSFGDYVLSDNYQDVARIPAFAKEVLVMHHGSILSLRGEKKIPVLSRNIEGIQFMVRRLRPHDLHHFITQSSGRFQNPDFSSNWKFTEDNIAETFTEERAINTVDPKKTNYHSFDFTKYINTHAANGARGIFFFSAAEWDPKTKSVTGESSKRFIVLTDLGIVAKTNVNNETQVFVQSFNSGKPVSGAQVDVLALNGTSLFSEVTDSKGRVTFPPFRNFEREKRPVAITVRYSDDYTFLPLGGQERSLNFQRFDVGGIESSADTDRILAFVFSDRGIYRPGDRANFGVIGKNQSWSSLPQGLPLEFVISNPQGTELVKEKFTLKGDGMEEFSFTTNETSPTGSYNAQVYLIRNDRRSVMLGSTSFKVEEFLPDRMKILATLSKESREGWIKMDKLKAKVLLTNLFGTPAQNRKIVSEFRLRPAFPNTNAYPEYHFLDPKKSKNSYVEKLDTVQTNDKGEAELELDLQKFAAASYRLEFLAEGFELEGGRSVSSAVSVFISPLDFVIGYKADGDLDYMKMNVTRKVHLQAVNNSMKKTSAKGLKASLIEYKYVSVLMEQSNKTYQYQSVRKEVPIGEPQKISIGEKGLSLNLDTSKNGNFVLVVKDEDGLIYAEIPYSVIGTSDLARGMDRNAELQIILDKSDYEKNDEIELQIRAPYTGAGLITIEREKVYAAEWFSTTSETSVHKIKIPSNLEGNAYVSVVFLRSLDSKEIYTSPLSYGIAAFTISRKSRKTEISIKTPDLVRPGETIKIHYSASRPTSMVLYGVDEGILQVASYKLPDPLSFFFTKRSLQVETSQILDLLLPEFSIFQAVSAAGGDEGNDAIGLNLNPFKRRRDKPVTFWSGILQASEKDQVFSYEVPDYFNGSMRLMAVASATGAVGNQATSTIVRGDFVLSPNVPMFVTPGDEFEVSVGISNTATGSKEAKGVKLKLITSEHLEVLSEKEKNLDIQEGSEKSEKFRLKAKTLLGSASVKFEVEWKGKIAKSSTDLSLRPALPYMTELKMGLATSAKTKIDVDRKMHDEFSKRSLSASIMPLTIADGLMNYLEQYPYGCTEQIVSKGLPALVFSNQKDFKVSAEIVKNNNATILRTLRSRQTSLGGFGLWNSQEETFDFSSLYAIHYLIEAKDHGYDNGNDLLERGLSYLNSGAFDKANSLHEARLWAYSLYLRARSSIVAKPSLETLRGLLEVKFKDEWKGDLTGVYLAGTYALLQKPEEGLKIIKSYKRAIKGLFDWNFFYDQGIRESQYLYITGRHFPDEIKKLSAADLLLMLSPLTNGNYTTVNSAYAILGLDAYVTATNLSGESIVKDVKIAEKWKGGEALLQLTGSLFPKAAFSKKAESIEINNPSSLKVFYQTTQGGFDLNLPDKTIEQGLEIQRDYLDKALTAVNTVKNGDELWVRLRARTVGDKGSVDNVAVVDLLPGGFEVVNESIRDDQAKNEGPASTLSTRSIDIREDRVVIFGTIGSDMVHFFYKIKATNVGTYVVPPPFAESMYDRTLKARGMAAKMVVAP